MYKTNGILSFNTKRLGSSSKQHILKALVRNDSDWVVLPRQTKRLFLPNLSKPKKVIEKRIKIPSSEVKIGPRVNKMGIQMLSKMLYNQVFKGYNPSKEEPALLEQCRKKLIKHGMVSTESDYVPDIDIQIPKLKGKNLEEHFYILGEEQSKPYRDIVNNLLEYIPVKPKNWRMQEGWTRYVVGKRPEIVPYPLEEGIIFDVEVCVQAGQSPVLATAVSNKAWYGWVSKSVIDGSVKPVTNHQYSLDSLIPLETENSKRKNIQKLREPKIVIGHNVSFDRARIKEQYYLERTGLRFLDTMSLHICVSGLTSYQRALLKSKKEEQEGEDDSWKKYSSLNSLSEVHNLYYGEQIEKETRNIFIEGNIQDIKDDFQNLMDYCSRDVIATHNILKKLFPTFLERFPHPVTLAGMLELGMAYLPVNSNWERYINESEQTYEDLDIESRLLLVKRADQACQLLHNEKYEENVWMWDQDWDIKEIKLKKKVVSKRKTVDIEASEKRTTIENENKRKNTTEESETKENLDDDLNILKEKFQYLFDSAEFLPVKIPLLPGYPNWYRKLCTKPNSVPDWVPTPHQVSTTMQVTPKLLSLTWEGYPLHFIRGLGWGFLVPFSDDLNIDRKVPLKSLLEKCPLIRNKATQGKFVDDPKGISKDVEESLARSLYFTRHKKGNVQDLYKGSGIWCDTVLEDCCWFFKLPHKNGPSYRVGNPLARDFLNKFSENVLSGDTESAEKVLSIARQLSYWRNNKDRIMQQMVVRLENNASKKHNSEDEMTGSIIPQVVVCGTLTRRAVEPTWMTASNAHPERIGSELRAMVQSPPGYYFVGADVDSQELWIASVIGDAYHANMHGCTPFGWMTLSGNKAAGTDMHSITAKTVGISRDHAKVINYARIYGAGQRFAESLLKQFNPTMNDSEAKSKATKMFNFTKGKQIYKLRDQFRTQFEEHYCNKWDAHQMAKLYSKTLHEMFEKPKWVEGTESAMFNRLEEIAGAEYPKTPFLNCSLSRALEPHTVNNDQFLPTRVNWVVQSGAVDFLHLMLVCMRWLVGDRARFCLSFHDEVRYLVSEENKYETALALHITNLLTRGFCCVRLGLYDMPQSIAFFSSVEVDKVLRKESKQDCVTPSNPHGLEKGYKIPLGESINIYQAIEKTGGKISGVDVE